MAAKLWLITWPSLCFSTYFSAVTICGNPVVPSFSEVGVSASTMLAPGAIACAHSTSSVVSCAQPTRLLLPEWNAGTLPAGWITRNDGGAGSLKKLSK